MVSLYHAADALVLPSLYEGLPNAVLESHASGLPAVVSHAANVDRLVLDGESGFEVPTFDHEALSEALARLFVLPAAERRAMGARGRAHIVANFSVDRVLAETVRLYDGLLAAKGLG
jgi:glycosyltransferase involved in cell wall biosynthesis